MKTTFVKRTITVEENIVEFFDFFKFLAKNSAAYIFVKYFNFEHHDRFFNETAPEFWIMGAFTFPEDYRDFLTKLNVKWAAFLRKNHVTHGCY